MVSSDSSSSSGIEDDSSSADMEESSSSGKDEDSLPGTADVSSADGTSTIPSEDGHDGSSDEDETDDESAESADDDDDDDDETEADDTDAESEEEESSSEVSASEAASATEVDSEESEEPSGSSGDGEESSEEAVDGTAEDVTESEVESDSEIPSESEEASSTGPASGTEVDGESDTEGSSAAGASSSESEVVSDTEAAIVIDNAANDSSTESAEPSATEVETESSDSASPSDADESSSVDEVTESEAASETEVSVSDSQVDEEVSISEEASETEVASETEASVSESQVGDEDSESVVASETEVSVSESQVDDEASGSVASEETDEASATEVSVSESQVEEEDSESVVPSDTEGASESEEEDDDSESENMSDTQPSESIAESESEVSEAGSTGSEVEESVTEVSNSDEEESVSEVASEVGDDDATNESNVTSGSEAPSESETAGDSEEGSSSEGIESGQRANEVSCEEHKVGTDEADGTSRSDTASGSVDPSASESDSVDASVSESAEDASASESTAEGTDFEDNTVSNQDDESAQTGTSESATVETRLSCDIDVHREDDRSVQTGTSESASVQTEVSPLVRKPTIGRVLQAPKANIDSCSESEPSEDKNDGELSFGENSFEHNSGSNSHLEQQDVMDESEESPSLAGASADGAQLRRSAPSEELSGPIPTDQIEIAGFDSDPAPDTELDHVNPLSGSSSEKASSRGESVLSRQSKPDPSPLMSKLESQRHHREDHQGMLDKVDVMSVGEISALTTDTAAMKRRARAAAGLVNHEQHKASSNTNVPQSQDSLIQNSNDELAKKSSDVSGDVFDVLAPCDENLGRNENSAYRDQRTVSQTHTGTNDSEERTPGTEEKPRLFRKKSGILRFIQRGISSVRPSYRRGVGEAEATSLTHANDEASSGSPDGEVTMNLEPIETINEDDEEEYHERSASSVLVPQRLPAIDFETASIRDDPSESPSVADSFDGVTESTLPKTTEKEERKQHLPSSQSKLMRDASDGTHNSGKGMKRFGFFPRPNLRRKYSTVGDDSQSEVTRHDDHDCPSLHFDNVPEASFDPKNQRSASKKSLAADYQHDFAAFPAPHENSEEASMPFPAEFSTPSGEPFFPEFLEPQVPRPSGKDPAEEIGWDSAFAGANPTTLESSQSRSENRLTEESESLVENDFSRSSRDAEESIETESDLGSQTTEDVSCSLEEDESFADSKSEYCSQATESPSIDDAYSSYNQGEDAQFIEELSRSSQSLESLEANSSESLVEEADESHQSDSGIDSASLLEDETQSNEEASHSAEGVVDDLATLDPSHSAEGSETLQTDESEGFVHDDDSGCEDNPSAEIEDDEQSEGSSMNDDELDDVLSEGSSRDEDEVLVDFMQMSDLISVSTVQDRELHDIEPITDQVSEAEEIESTMDNLFVGFTVEEALDTSKGQVSLHKDETQREVIDEQSEGSFSSESSPASVKHESSRENIWNPTTSVLCYDGAENHENADPITDSGPIVGDDKSIVIDFGDGEDKVAQEGQPQTADPLSNHVPDELELGLESRATLMQLPQESFLTRGSHDSSTTGNGSKARVKDALARMGLSRNSPKKLHDDCSGSHGEHHDPSKKIMSPPSSPASPLRNLAEKARQRLSAVKQLPTLPSPASSTTSRTIVESAQRELASSNPILSTEADAEEVTAYDVEELDDHNAVEYFPTQNEGGDQRTSDSSDSIGFDEDGVSVALFQESDDIPDDYTYSKESLDIRARSGHEARKLNDQSDCWNMNNSADVSQDDSGAFGPIGEQRDEDGGKKSWPFRRRGGRRPEKDIGTLDMEIDVVESVLPQTNPSERLRTESCTNKHENLSCKSQPSKAKIQEVKRDSTKWRLWSKRIESDRDLAPSISASSDNHGRPDEESMGSKMSSVGRQDKKLLESSRGDELSVPRGDEERFVHHPTTSHHEKERKPRRRRKPGKEWCTTIAIILLLVFCGIGCGVIASMLLRQRDSSATAVAPPIPQPQPTTLAHVPSPTIVTLATPTRAPVLGQAQYDMICSEMEDCSRLFDLDSASGKAFDWLIDPMYNPDLLSLPDSKAITRYALAAIFYSTDGESWVNRLNWLSAQDECTWFSSSTLLPCDSSGFFISLDIENNNLQGTLPSEIGFLTTLQILRLRSPSTTARSLVGSIPSSIGLLTSLSTLEISGNSLTGFIPTTVGRLRQLKSLNLRSNGLEGDVPYQFDALTKLSHLDLSHNSFSGVFPPELLRSASGLEELILVDNKITKLPDEISNLQKLRVIDLAQNQLSQFPIGVTRLYQSLQHLDISYNNMFGTIPSEIGSMQALRALTLSHNRLTGTLPSSLGNILSLHEIMDLGHNELTGTIPLQMGQIGRLKKLYLNSNRLSGSIPSELVRLNQINAVRIDDNMLSGQVPILLCDLYSFTNPISYADCDKLSGGQDCFTYCCTEATGCRCRFESSNSADEFLRCLG